MYIERDLEPVLLNMATKFPIITLCGPRQSGKTTLLRKVFPHLPYVNLEQTKERVFVQDDRVAFLERFPDGAIFDEVQRVPDLLSDLQVIVDERKRMGMFIISGSQQFNLLETISQSLAGRTTVLRLLPLTLGELKRAHIHENSSVNMTLLSGFYPGKFERDVVPEDFFGAYEESYVERDLKQLVNIKDLSVFRKFLKLCAGRIGSLLNKESLSRDVGVTPKTVEQWLSLLETSFIMFRAQPWHTNLGKRLIKSPKLYFYDVGLACYLLGIYKEAHLEAHPLRGELFENLQMTEVVKTIANLGLKREAYFYRDSTDNEVDVLVSSGTDLLPIEIKSSKTFSPSFVSFLKKFDVPSYQSPHGKWLVMGCEQSEKRTGFDLIGWRDLGQRLHVVLTEF
jgi:predicted AAA+ superfamily ATPase